MIPNKLQAGQNFKQSTVQTINQIIDYLKTQRIVTDNKTLRVNQLTNGVSITAIETPATRSGGGGSDDDFPFKLSIITDANQNKKLQISPARISINSDVGTRVYFADEDNNNLIPMQISLPNASGDYSVIGYVVKDSNAPASPFNTLGYGNGIIYVPTTATTDKFTITSGFYCFNIGTVHAETVDNQLTFTISEQLLNSSFDISDFEIDRPFRGHWQKQSYPSNGTIQQSLIADKFLINAGSIFSDKNYVQIAAFSENISNLGNSQFLYCIAFNVNNYSGQIVKINPANWVYYDNTTNIYNIPLCLIFSSASTAVGLTQIIYGDLVINFKGEIYLSSADQTGKPYLHDKISYPTKDITSLTTDEQAIYSGGSYLIGITENINSGSSSAAVDLVDHLYWDWTAIPGYSKTKKQVLQNNSASLRWTSDTGSGGGQVPEHTAVGSLEVLFEFTENTSSGNDTIAMGYKPENDVAQQGGAVQFIIQDKSKQMKRLTFRDENSGQAVMYWDYASLQPKLSLPPQSGNYLLACNDGVLTWVEYANCQTACDSSSSSNNNGE